MNEPTLFKMPRRTPEERLRAIQTAKINRGEHPLSRVGEVPRRILLAPEGTGTCGSCVHKMRPAHYRRAYPKCAAGTIRIPAGRGFTEVWPRASRSLSTDVLAGWPACTSYESSEETP
jgi:hypothetical protein